jgi:hypothetical protein
MLTVHLPFGFSSVKLIAMTAIRNDWLRGEFALHCRFTRARSERRESVFS